MDSEDLTENATEEAWDLYKNALPNVKMVFGSSEPYFSSFLGWGDLPENYATLSREQATGRLRQMAELAVWNAELKDQIFEYELLEDDPLTLSFILKYTDGGQYYWDMGVDIIATPECAVSLKISTAVEELTDEELIHLQTSLASLRRMVVAKHGAVQFDPVGTRVTLASVTYQILLIAACLFVGAIFYWIYSWNYLITPSKASRRYSVFIVILSGIMISFTFLVNELVGFNIAESQRVPYVGLIHWLFVLAIHTWSYRIQSPFSVLASVSYIVGGLTLTLWSVLVGWMAPTSALTGTLIGSLLVIYVLRTSSTRKKPFVLTDGRKHP
ncbi:hypothetical protein MYX82_12890 [Acidobacteria bacterium AH-259-D05]|nr:hypothetical protein [Acidobacteria bacterium AH-259-D05]